MRNEVFLGWLVCFLVKVSLRKSENRFKGINFCLIGAPKMRIEEMAEKPYLERYSGWPKMDESHELLYQKNMNRIN